MMRPQPVDKDIPLTKALIFFFFFEKQDDDFY